MTRVRTLAVCIAALGVIACPAEEATTPEAASPAGAASPPAGATSQPAGAASQPSAGPAAAKRGLGPEGEIRPSPEDRCPVCAMKPHTNPKFASGLELEDGRTFYTCGTGCFLRAHLHPEVYLGSAKVKRAAVPDYFTGEAIEADAAYWVAGSDVKGPMGPAPVALSSEEDVETFRRRHGGPHRFRLEDLDDARFEEITGKPALRR